MEMEVDIMNEVNYFHHQTKLNNVNVTLPEASFTKQDWRKTKSLPILSFTF